MIMDECVVRSRGHAGYEAGRDLVHKILAIGLAADGPVKFKIVFPPNTTVSPLFAASVFINWDAISPMLSAGSEISWQASHSKVMHAADQMIEEVITPAIAILEEDEEDEAWDWDDDEDDDEGDYE